MADPTLPRQDAAVWLVLLRDDPDDAALQERFQTWLKADPLHAQAWASVNRAATTLAHMGGSPQSQPAPQPAPRRVRPRLRTLWPVPLGLAAACACLFVASPDLLLRWQADQYTTVGETRTIALPDGSAITLAPRTAVSIQTKDQARMVTLLQGEALFKVRHDPAHPFAVMAGGVKATDIGTVFDVLLSAQGTTVAVREGASQVQAADGTTAPQDLGPGNWVSIEGTTTTRGTRKPDTIGLWSDGLLMADAMPLSTLIARIRPWQTGAIVLLDPALGQQTVSGVYDLRQPTRALALAVRQHGGRVRQFSRWLTVISRS